MATAALCASTLALFARTFVVSLVEVRSVSMVETLQPGDHIVVSKLVAPPGTWRLTPPLRRRDVVLFRRPAEPHRELIKRAVALPGDRVALDQQGLTIDAFAIDEASSLSSPSPNAGGDLEPTVVDDGQIVVLGDARGHSRDSRHFGPITNAWIHGRAVIILFSTESSATGSLRDWGTIERRFRATSSRTERWLKPIR